MLSNTSKYAIRAAIYLALHGRDGQKIDIKTIAAALKIPSPFLAKILQLLAKQKILLSTKGPNGGFSLGRDADEISIYEIITIIDGSDMFEKCLISLRSCLEEGIPCPMHEKYDVIRKDLIMMFKEQTLGNLVYDMKAQNRIIAL